MEREGESPGAQTERAPIRIYEDYSLLGLEAV
jgi:hypothetical protein